MSNSELFKNCLDRVWVSNGAATPTWTAFPMVSFAKSGNKTSQKVGSNRNVDANGTLWCQTHNTAVNPKYSLKTLRISDEAATPELIAVIQDFFDFADLTSPDDYVDILVRFHGQDPYTCTVSVDKFDEGGEVDGEPAIQGELSQQGPPTPYTDELPAWPY
jgi:hypothetical protein